jgi:uncharacterized protein (TIGR02284 family)
MENNNSIIIEQLNNLIDMAEDGKEGYENASKDVKDVKAKTSFLLFAEQRSTYSKQLKELVFQLKGEAADNGGDAKGSLHRIWMDFKAIFTAGNTEAIINACITGEEAAIKEYQLVLDDDVIPQHMRVVIGEQLIGIQQTLASIKSHVID